MNELGILPYVVEMALNHSTGTALSRVYNSAQYLNEKTEAMQRWSDHVERIVSGANVIPFSLKEAIR